MKPKEIPLATLVEDFSLYPRHRVEEVHVSDLVRAIQSGQTLPPIIADAKSLRIVDGFHRRRAYLKVLGDEATALVELRTYKDEAALFLQAVELNSAHGRKLDRQDQTRIVLKLRELNVPDQQISLSLHIPEPVIQVLSLRIVHAPSGPIPSKRGLEHMRGQSLNSAQVTAMQSVRSAEAGRLCMELTALLENNLVDLSDTGIVERLERLVKAIRAALKAVAA